MTVNDQVRDEEIQNTILIEKQPKYQPYHQVKLIRMNIFKVKKYYHLVNNK